jgi:predicted metalloendopeptidase
VEYGHRKGKGAHDHSVLKLLNLLTVKIGYADYLFQRRLYVRFGGAKYSTGLLANNAEAVRNSAYKDRQYLKVPVDKSEWSMAPSKVNAYYVCSVLPHLNLLLLLT